MGTVGMERHGTRHHDGTAVAVWRNVRDFNRPDERTIVAVLQANSDGVIEQPIVVVEHASNAGTVFDLKDADILAACDVVGISPLELHANVVREWLPNNA